MKPLSVKQFLSEHWPHRHHVTHGPLERLEALTRIPALQDVRSLAHAYGERIPVWFPKELKRQTLQSIYGSHFQPLDALVLYAAGATLFFKHVDRWVPALRPMLRQLEHELSLPPGSAYCSAFASPGEAGAVAHFDHDFNFTLQLRGRKRWLIAENRHVRSPTRGYNVLDHAQALPEELALYSPPRLPAAMPRNATTVELEPGSVMFLPRGYWHTTHTHEESLALVFVLAPPTWGDVVLEQLRRELLKDERWRMHASGLWGEPSLRAEAQRQLASLLEQLPGAASRLQLQDFARGQAASTARHYQRNAQASARLTGSNASGWQLSVEPRDMDPAEVTLPQQFVPLCRWVLARKRPFSAQQASHSARSLHEDDVHGMLETLVEAGALEHTP